MPAASATRRSSSTPVRGDAHRRDGDGHALDDRHRAAAVLGEAARQAGQQSTAGRSSTSRRLPLSSATSASRCGHGRAAGRSIEGRQRRISRRDHAGDSDESAIISGISSAPSRRRTTSSRDIATRPRRRRQGRLRPGSRRSGSAAEGDRRATPTCICAISISTSAGASRAGSSITWRRRRQRRRRCAQRSEPGPVQRHRDLHYAPAFFAGAIPPAADAAISLGDSAAKDGEHPANERPDIGRAPCSKSRPHRRTAPTSSRR